MSTRVQVFGEPRARRVLAEHFAAVEVSAVSPDPRRTLPATPGPAVEFGHRRPGTGHRWPTATFNPRRERRRRRVRAVVAAILTVLGAAGLAAAAVLSGLLAAYVVAF